MATPSGTLMSTRLVFSKSKGLRQKPAPTVPVMEQKKKSIDRSISELDSLLSGGLDDESIGANNNANNNNNNSATEPKEALPENRLPSDVEKLFELMDNEEAAAAAAGDESTHFDDDGSGNSLQFLQEDRFHRQQQRPPPWGGEDNHQAYASCPENNPDSIAFIDSDDNEADSSSNERELMRSAHTHWTQQSSLSLATSRSAPDVSKLHRSKKGRRRRRRRHKRGNSLERKISATIIEKAAHDRSLFVPQGEMTSDKSIDEILLDLATLPRLGGGNPYTKLDSQEANGPPIPSLSDLYSRSVLDDDDDDEEEDEALESAPTTDAVAPVSVNQVASTEAVAAMDQVRPLCALDLEPDNDDDDKNKNADKSLGGDNKNNIDKEQHLLEEIMHSIQTNQSAGSVTADLSAVVSNSSMTFSSQEPMSSFSTAGPSVASQSVGDLLDCISGSTVDDKEESLLPPTPEASESDAFAGIDLVVVPPGTGSWVDFGSMPTPSTDPVPLPANGTLSFPSLRAASDFADQDDDDDDDERIVEPAESGPLSGEEQFRVVEEPQDAALYFQVDPYNNSILADDDEDDDEPYDDLAAAVAATKLNHDNNNDDDDDEWTAFGEDNPFLDRITVTSFSTAPSQTSVMPKDAKQPDSPTSVVISTAGTTGRETPDNWEAFEGTRFEI